MLVLELGRKDRIDHLTFSPDGRALVASYAAGLSIWRDITDGQKAAQLPGPANPGTARFTCDGRWLFASRGEVWRIDPATGDHVTSQLWGGHGARFDLSPTKPLLVATQRLSGGHGSRTRLGLWGVDDLSPAGNVWEREVDGFAYYPPHFLPGGGRFVRAEGGWVAERSRHEFRLATYDTATGEWLGQPTPLPHSAYETFVSPDGCWLAMCDANHIDLWPLERVPASPVRVRNDNRKHFTDLAFHPSGRYLAAPSNDWTVKFFETSTWAETRSFTWEMGRMRSITFSPDGALAAAGTDKGQVIVWDMDL